MNIMNMKGYKKYIILNVDLFGDDDKKKLSTLKKRRHKLVYLNNEMYIE